MVCVPFPSYLKLDLQRCCFLLSKWTCCVATLAISVGLSSRTPFPGERIEKKGVTLLCFAHQYDAAVHRLVVRRCELWARIRPVRAMTWSSLTLDGQVMSLSSL